MKTKIKNLIAENEARIKLLENNKEIAAKLEFNTECHSLSKRIKEIEIINNELEKLIK